MTNMFLAQPLLFKSFCYINGHWVHSDSGSSTPVYNPADQTVLGHIPMLTREQINSAIDAAQTAYEQWRFVPVNERAKILHRWAELITSNREDLAKIITLEQGKPITEALGEIDYAASFIPWYAEQAKRLDGRFIPSHLDDSQPGTFKEAIGVAALITPWNFPSAMITRKAAAAIAAGCAVVVKPAHETPFSATALAQLAEQAGFPAGIFNVVIGEPQMAMETLVSHPLTRAVSFTGSTRVGNLVNQTAANSGIKKVALELGGNAPLIVSADADLDQAVKTAIDAKYQTSGQDCCAANRIFVHRSVYKAFVDRFAKQTAKLKVGSGLDRDVKIGPLIHEAALNSTSERVQDAIEKGARLIVGGKQHANGGLFYQPTVLADVAPGMRIYDEENFAPITGILAYDDLDDAISMANDTEYGLAAYICASRHNVIWHLIKKLDFAMVAVNSAHFTGAPVPFGGKKQSGLGREGGDEGFEPFTETKYFCLGNLALEATN